jgi:hypothetical protein
MGRSTFGRCATCEGSLSVDVREWHRLGLLRTGQRFSWFWTHNGKPAGNIHVRSAGDAVVVLRFEPGQTDGDVSKSGAQRVPLVWTKCHLGGRRCWFQCVGDADGQGCGRRAAKLYLGARFRFACRRCSCLAYMSQSENPRNRAISKAQKARSRLGGLASLVTPFPGKAPRMHWRTFYKLFDKAADAQERYLALALEDLRRCQGQSGD